MIESYKHSKNSFVTLTYDDQHLPLGGTLVPRHYQLFLKSLRKKVAPAQIRFYCAGEYGEISQRPHYHLAIFGLGLEDEKDITDSWPHGFVHIGTLTLDSAQYLTKYIQKGLTKPDTDELNGRFPEFSRMSLRPGIGATAVPDIADTLTSESGVEVIAQSGDVPRSLTHGKSRLPLGRYLRRKLREHIGLDEEKIKKDNMSKWSEKMCEMLTEAQTLATPKERSEAAQNVFSHKQKIRNLEAKNKIFKKGSKL